MQYIPLGANAYDANAYGLPAVKLENWYAEEAPDRNDRPYRLIPTPGLTSFTSGLNGAVRGLFQADGLLSGDLVTAAGLRAYRINSSGTATELGTITGTDGVSFAGSQLDLVMTAGGTAYTVGASSLTAITVGGASGSIVDVAEIDQRHLFLEDGSGRFWWSDVADASTVQGASFGTAASEPDNVLALHVYSGTVMLFGTQSTEGWYATGDEDQAFRPRPGFSVDTGIIGRDAVVAEDFGLFVVGHRGVVYRLEGFRPVRVSTHSIERLIEDVASDERANIRLSSHRWGGHTFVGLHLPGVGDYFYDAATSTWHRRKELNNARHLVHVYEESGGNIYAGDRFTGAIYRLDRDVYTYNANAVRRVATAVIPVEDNRPAITNLTAEFQGGVGLDSGQGVDPQCMMRFAPDGQTFGNEVKRGLGKKGRYGHRAVFGSLGRFAPPAMAVEIAVSDPVPATITGVAIDRAKV